MITAREMPNKIRKPRFLNRLVEPYSSDCFAEVLFGLKLSEISTMYERILSIGMSLPSLKFPNSSINDKMKRALAGIKTS